jgi:hypothetical protein
VEGAFPANPYHAGLASMKVTLLQARAMLTDDARNSQRWLVGARAAQARLDTLSAESREADISTLGETVAAMLRPVPFGPRGAVRAGVRVPKPRLLTDPRLPVAQRPRGVRWQLALELVIDTEGRVVQVFAMDSSEGYDKALVDAIGRWHYEPSRLDGELVPVILTMR